MIDRGVQGRKDNGIWLQVLLPAGRSDKWLGEERRGRAGVTQSIGRLRFVDADRVALNDRIIDSIACTNARFRSRRIRQSQAGRKAVAQRDQGRRDSFVTWIYQASECRRVDL